VEETSLDHVAKLQDSSITYGLSLAVHSNWETCVFCVREEGRTEEISILLRLMSSCGLAGYSRAV